MMPTCMMKLTPLPRFSRSLEGESPARMEGVRRSSDSLKSHWDSERRRRLCGEEGGR